VISKPERAEGAGSWRPDSNGFCPQCRGELRSPKRYIIKAQVPYYSEQQIKRVSVVRRANGYYCQFLIDVERQEYHEPTGQLTGIDLGLKEFYTDAQGNTIENPRYLSKSEKQLKKAQRRLSKRFRQGNKQSKNYHKQRIKVAKLHLKVSRQRKDKAIKDALAVVQSNDLVVYEALKVRNLAGRGTSQLEGG
jgi:putative transposase